MLVPVVRRLRQAAQADTLQLGRHPRLDGPGPVRLRFEDLLTQLDRCRSAERPQAGYQLIEDDPQGIEVGAMVHGSKAIVQLLWSHVGQSSGCGDVPEQFFLDDGDAEVSQVGSACGSIRMLAGL